MQAHGGGDRAEATPPRVSSSSAAAGNGNVDRVLYKNLVEMVPLVESLMDRRANSTFTRRASLIYTRTPARESQTKKDVKVKKTRTLPAKKRGTDNEAGKNIKRDNRDSWTDEFSAASLRMLSSEKDHSELLALQKEMEDLQKKLSVKEEIIKSAEDSLSQMEAIHAKLSELTFEIAEKDSFLKSAQLQLSDCQMKLANKQATLEKLQWELMTSRSESDKIQKDLDYAEQEVGIFLEAIASFVKDYTDVDVVKKSNFDYLDHLPPIEQEKLVDAIELQKMENARQTYIKAVAYAKQNLSEESLALAAEARQQLCGVLGKIE